MDNWTRKKGAGYFFPLVLVLLALGVSGCPDNNPVGVNEAENNVEENRPGPAEIPVGTYGLVLSLSMDSRSESWPNVGGNISWGEADLGLLRYLPELDMLDLLASTTSFSFSTTHIYPLTMGQRLFVVNTRSGKQISEYDPRSGIALGTVCQMNTDDTYSGFALVGEQVFYLNGERTLMVDQLPCSGTPTPLLSQSEHGIGGRMLYGIGDKLVSGRWSDGQYILRRHDTASGAVVEALLSVDEAGLASDFFAGDDGLYWALFADGSKRLTVMRYPLAGEPEVIMSQTLTTGLNPALAIDQSGGKVLVAYMDGFVASGGQGHFLVWDKDSGVVEALDIDPSFYSQRIFGTQFLVF